MKIHVGDKFPDSNLYIYNDGNMEKTNTYKIFDSKKIINSQNSYKLILHKFKIVDFYLC